MQAPPRGEGALDHKYSGDKESGRPAFRSRSATAAAPRPVREIRLMGAGGTGVGHGHAAADPADLRCVLARWSTVDARVFNVRAGPGVFEAGHDERGGGIHEAFHPSPDLIGAVLASV